MDTEALHDLTAAYALDALDHEERVEFEAHLASCDRCREEVAELTSVAASLAYAADPVAPPASLRGRILDAAQAERPNVVPLRPRRAYPVVAAVAACAALGLGIWNISLHGDLGNSNAQAIERVPVTGAPNSFVVYSGKSAGLVLSGVGAAPSGKTYEAWVIHGNEAAAAGVFRAGSGTTYVALDHPVAKGEVVAVTVEPAGGSTQPTTKPFVVSEPI